MLGNRISQHTSIYVVCWTQACFTSNMLLLLLLLQDHVEACICQETWYPSIGQIRAAASRSTFAKQLIMIKGRVQ